MSDSLSNNSILIEIGDLNHKIYLKNKKIDTRNKILKYILTIKIYNLLKTINGNKWEYYDKYNLFISTYLDDLNFYKKHMEYIFKLNISKEIKETLPIDLSNKIALKVIKYLTKNQSRITSSETNLLSCQDYIRLYEALQEDQEQFKIDIYTLLTKINSKLYISTLNIPKRNNINENIYKSILKNKPNNISKKCVQFDFGN